MGVGSILSYPILSTPCLACYQKAGFGSRSDAPLGTSTYTISSLFTYNLQAKTPQKKIRRREKPDAVCGSSPCKWPACHPSRCAWPTTGTRGSTSKVANSPATGPLSWKPTSPRSRRACTVAYHTRQMGRVSMSRASQGVAPCFRRRPRHQAVVPPSPTSSSNRWSKCVHLPLFLSPAFLRSPACMVLLTCCHPAQILCPLARRYRARRNRGGNGRRRRGRGRRRAVPG